MYLQIFLTVCNINLVDGSPWTGEVVGSNPTAQTNSPKLSLIGIINDNIK